MIEKKSRRSERIRKHKIIRQKVKGTEERPRLCVFRSNKNIYAQIINDVMGSTIVATSSLDPEVKKQLKSSGNNIERASIVGSVIAKKALEKGIKKVVYDRGGYLYHGRVKALAESARSGGLEF